jgi:hypothetical protein
VSKSSLHILAATRKSRGGDQRSGYRKFFVSFVSFVVNFSRFRQCPTRMRLSENCSGRQWLKSKHEHASRRPALFFGEGTRGLGLLRVDQRLSRLGPRHCWEGLELLSARAIALRLQVMGSRPLTDADARLQTIFVRRPEMNTTIQTTHCRFLRRSEAGWKAAVHAGQKI